MDTTLPLRFNNKPLTVVQKDITITNMVVTNYADVYHR
jgi:hypothetical protein